MYIVRVLSTIALVHYSYSEPVRLVNGTGPSEGRLEVYVTNTIGGPRWGTIPIDPEPVNRIPGTDEARVICQQLGFPGPAVVTNSGVFGPGMKKDPLNFVPISCREKIDDVKRPAHTGECDTSYSTYNSYAPPEDHNLDMGIVCNVTWPPPLRLVGGSGPHEGRLEVFFKDKWGSICWRKVAQWKDEYEQVMINSVCRTLGYNSGRMLPARVTNFGSSQGPIWITNIICPYTPKDYIEFTDCVPRWGNDGLHCNHTDDIAIICNASDPTIPTTIRLVGGAGPHEGRVEVQTNGKWGRLRQASTKWESKPVLKIPYPDGVANDFSASVICQQLGYNNVDVYETAPDVFGPGTGDVYNTLNFCDGDYDYPCVYRYRSYDTEELIRLFDAVGDIGIGIVCNVKSTPEVRLVDGPTPNEGRLEMKFRDEWGSVCDEAIVTEEEVTTVCKLLGYSGRNQSAVYITTTQYGNGDLPRIWYYSGSCLPGFDGYWRDHSGKMTLCAKDYYGDVCNYNDSDAAVGIACDGSTPAVPIRLVGGSGPYEGRLEVFNAEEWGTVCVDDFKSWGQAEADAVCHQLGYHPGPQDKRSLIIGVHKGTTAKLFGESSENKIWLDDVQCAPDDTDSRMILKDCKHSEWGGSGLCDHSNDVGVVCGTISPYSPSIVLVGGNGPNEGRLEINFQKEWGTVCFNEEFDYGKLPEIVCKQIGLAGYGTATLTRTFGAGEGRIWLENLWCNGTEYDIDTCRHPAWGTSQCNHTMDIGIICASDVYAGSETSQRPCKLCIAIGIMVATWLWLASR
ncbi:scavenger receptor cysteine-rich type 1 protein M160-like [Amphiura filiformis]|uniref:scavenger receptor cysteine-rich type 1 protein M160-like n=1 Tax=Amphiura filiformis TaxID=82378 RepID=UPI003B21DD44